MKRVLFVVLAAAMFVACSKNTSDAEKQSVEYKAEWSEITSLLDAEVVEAEGFDAWYDTLSNSEVRALGAAAEELAASYAEAEHWYKNLSDAEQEVARAAGEAWEKENPALQLQVELFAENLVDVDMPLLKLCAEELAEVSVEEPEVEPTDLEPTEATLSEVVEE